MFFDAETQIDEVHVTNPPGYRCQLKDVVQPILYILWHEKRDAVKAAFDPQGTIFGDDMMKYTNWAINNQLESCKIRAVHYLILWAVGVYDDFQLGSALF